MSYRVTIDKDTCVSSGKCVADHPTAFTFDADELSTVAAGVTDLDDATLLKAARRCPSGAIELTDIDTGEPVDI